MLVIILLVPHFTDTYYLEIKKPLLSTAFVYTIIMYSSPNILITIFYGLYPDPGSSQSLLSYPQVLSGPFEEGGGSLWKE